MRATAQQIEIDACLTGFAEARLTNVTAAWIEGAGHYAADENAIGVAAVIRELVHQSWSASPVTASQRPRTRRGRVRRLPP